MKYKESVNLLLNAIDANKRKDMVWFNNQLSTEKMDKLCVT